MQDYAKSKWTVLQPALFFACLTLLAYLPVSSGWFFLKNDAFTGYFPPKFYMSESLQSGLLPLWNPYINFGFPQYGDMSGGYWSPITWLMASTVGYNAYTFTAEVLLYIFLGGWGMYQLGSCFSLSKYSRMVAGISFLCGGYVVGHLQHFNWLSGAAFLPWCWWSYEQLLRNNCGKHQARTILLLGLLIASAHPGIIICSGYFFLFWMIFRLVQQRRSGDWNGWHWLKIHAILWAGIALISTGMILGYADILPHFVRGEKLDLVTSLMHPTNWKCWISGLLPLSIVKENVFFDTDVSMRNGYMGLTVLVFLLHSILSRKTALQRFLLWMGLFFALLASGGIFKTAAYYVMPLIGYVRLNGEFRIFALICFIWIAVLELNRFMVDANAPSLKLRRIFNALSILLLCAIVLGFVQSIRNHSGLLFQWEAVVHGAGLAEQLKLVIDNLTIWDAFWLQGAVQLLLLTFIRRSVLNRKTSSLCWWVAIDLSLACLLNIPFTGVGKASLKQVDQVLQHSPKGIVRPGLQPIVQHDTATTDINDMVGHWSMYNKQIGTVRQVVYPIALKNMNAYFEENEHPGGKNYLKEPFVFLLHKHPHDRLAIESYSPEKIILTVTVSRKDTLVFQQNWYPHWWVKIDQGEPVPLQAFGTAFMQTPVPAGKHTVVLRFQPKTVKKGMLVSVIGWTTLLFYLLITLVFPSWLQKRPRP